MNSNNTFSGLGLSEMALQCNFLNDLPSIFMMLLFSFDRANYTVKGSKTKNITFIYTYIIFL